MVSKLASPLLLVSCTNINHTQAHLPGENCVFALVFQTTIFQYFANMENILNLPHELFHAILIEAVLACGTKRGLRLRIISSK